MGGYPLRYPLMKLSMKARLNWTNKPVDLASNLLNQTLTDPLKAIGKALHIISLSTHCNYIMVLKDSK